jgi:hypothetical protein
MSASKISIALAATALMVSVLFATPIGQAAGNFVLSKNSVGTAQIKKNAVNSLKVKNGTLMAADFKAGQLPAGAPGPQGIQGAAGAAGPPGPTQVTFVHTGLIKAPTGTATSGRADCPSGQVPTGGGAEFVYIPGETRESIKTSIPVKYPFGAPYPTAWLVWVNNTTGSSVSFLVYAICVTPTSVS